MEKYLPVDFIVDFLKTTIIIQTVYNTRNERERQNYLIPKIFNNIGIITTELKPSKNDIKLKLRGLLHSDGKSTDSDFHSRFCV